MKTKANANNQKIIKRKRRKKEIKGPKELETKKIYQNKKQKAEKRSTAS
jgi:hypothetical protein